MDEREKWKSAFAAPVGKALAHQPGMKMLKRW